MAYITLDQAKDHIRVDHTDDDIYITELIDVCETSILNEIAGVILVSGTVTTNGTTALTGDSSASFLSQVKAGDSIKVQGETSRIVGAVTSDTALTVTVAFSTSLGSLTYVITPSPLVSGVLPMPIKQAILLLIGHLYNQREPVIIGTSAVKIPNTLEFLIAPYKNWVVA